MNRAEYLRWRGSRWFAYQPDAWETVEEQDEFLASLERLAGAGMYSRLVSTGGVNRAAYWRRMEVLELIDFVEKCEKPPEPVPWYRV